MKAASKVSEYESTLWTTEAYGVKLSSNSVEASARPRSELAAHVRANIGYCQTAQQQN